MEADGEVDGDTKRGAEQWKAPGNATAAELGAPDPAGHRNRRGSLDHDAREPFVVSYKFKPIGEIHHLLVNTESSNTRPAAFAFLASGRTNGAPVQSAGARSGGVACP